MRYVCTLLLLLVATDSAAAQGMFGPRSLGQGISGRSSARGSSGRSSADDTEVLGTSSSLQGRRFTREARTAGDFVGANTQSEAAGNFVGAQSTAQTAVAAAVGITETAIGGTNRRRVVRPAGIYPERLTLAPELQQAAAVIPGSAARQESASAVAVWAEAQGISLQVSVDSRQALVSGTVPSEKDRQTAELLLLLEPGVDRVRNQLTVMSAAAPERRHLPPEPSRRRRIPPSLPQPRTRP